jgi:hypothetical protein
MDLRMRTSVRVAGADRVTNPVGGSASILTGNVIAGDRSLRGRARTAGAGVALDLRSLCRTTRGDFDV